MDIMAESIVALAETLDADAETSGWGLSPRMFAVHFGDEALGLAAEPVEIYAPDLLRTEFPTDAVGVAIVIEGARYSDAVREAIDAGDVDSESLPPPSETSDAVATRMVAVLLRDETFIATERDQDGEQTHVYTGMSPESALPVSVIWQLRRILEIPSNAPVTLSPRRMYARALAVGAEMLLSEENAWATESAKALALVPEPTPQNLLTFLAPVRMFGETMGFCTAVLVMFDDWDDALGAALVGLTATVVAKREQDSPRVEAYKDMPVEWRPSVCADELEEFIDYLRRFDGPLFAQWLGYHFELIPAAPVTDETLLTPFTEIEEPSDATAMVVYDRYKSWISSMLRIDDFLSH